MNIKLMKKNILIACITLIGLTQINAQTDYSFGAKAGINISVFGGGTSFDYFAKPGFHLGGVLEIANRSKLSFQPEALISLQGSGGFFQDKLNFWYLNVPVMAKYEILEDFYIEVGPQVGLLLSDNLDINSFGASQALETTNTIDYGLAFGGGYRLDENFYFQIRFNLGLINAIENLPSKNNNFQISAVYFL